MAKVIALRGAWVEGTLPLTWEKEPEGLTEKGVKNPCISCEYEGLCDSDECAMKCYPLDVPTTRFKNLEQYIQFMKHQDWL